MATEASNDINDLYHHDKITETQTDTKVIPKVEETSKSPRETETKIQKNREDIREKLNLLKNMLKFATLTAKKFENSISSRLH